MPGARLTIVVPGLLDPPPALRAGATTLPRAPVLEALLAQADRSFHGCTGLLEVLALHAEAPQILKLAGPLSWSAEGGDTIAGEATCLRADPVSMLADSDRPRIVQGDTVAPDEDESDALIGHLNGYFAADGLAFRRGTHGGWYLFCAEAIDAETTPPYLLERGDLRDAQPSGADGARLRQLMNEIQMLLHEHPVNETRARRGRPPVNAAWLWGAGPMPSPAVKPFDSVFADDALPRALGVRASRLPGGPATVAVNGTGRSVLVVTAPVPWLDPLACAHYTERLEREWFAPLQALLHGGRWGELLIDGCDGWAWRCTRGQRWTRWWRRRDLVRIFADVAATT